MLGYIVKFFKALNSNSKPGEIAHAFCIGVLLGFMPKGNLLWILMFVLFSFIRINKGSYYIMMIIASCFAYLLDPLFNTIGYAVLTWAPLEKIFAFLIDVPFVGFTKFNNTIVMGSLVSSIVVYIPLFILFRVLIGAWRKVVAPAIMKLPIVKAISTLPLVKKIASLADDMI